MQAHNPVLVKVEIRVYLSRELSLFYRSPLTNEIPLYSLSLLSASPRESLA
jgi:hypothetical protein